MHPITPQGRLPQYVKHHDAVGDSQSDRLSVDVFDKTDEQVCPLQPGPPICDVDSHPK